MSFSEKRKFDVIVVGGGVIGLSIARELHFQGVERVAILEKNPRCGTEASNAAAGMLAPQAEARDAGDFYRLCNVSRNLYPIFADNLLRESGVDIELDYAGTLYLAVNERDSAVLEQRFAWQRAADLLVGKMTAAKVLELEPNVNPNICAALYFGFDWQVENRKLMRALVESSNAVRLCDENVREITFERNKAVAVKTETNQFFADKIVVASGAWTSLLRFPKELNCRLEVKPIRGQIICFQAAEPLFRHVIHTPRGYLVPRKDNRILIGATVEDAGFNREIDSRASDCLHEIWNEIRAESVSATFQEQWLGFRPKTADGLPLLGEFPEGSGLFFATGHYRNGILLAPVTAKIIADKIVNNLDSPFLKVFNPNRFINNH